MGKSEKPFSRWILITLCLIPHPTTVNSGARPLNTTEQAEVQEHIERNSAILKNLLENYDKRFIPTKPGFPLVVELEVKVADVLNLNDNLMESDMIIFIRQIWYDYRLAYGNSSDARIKVREHLLEKIWMPDVRMSNLKEMKRFSGFGGINMNIYPNGRIYYSQLALVKVSCPMDLRNFPMDKQTCFLNFSSYAYAKTTMFFEFAGHKILVNPVNLAQYDFVSAEEILHPEGTSSVPKVTIGLTFQRRLGYYVIQIYIPAIFVVVLSWLSFLMESTNIADRLALEVTMILTITFLLGGINTSLPKVSYPKASDWYVIASFIFVFLALLETMLVYRLTSETFQSNHGKRLFKKHFSSIASVFKKKTTPQVLPEMTDRHPTATQTPATNTVNVHEDAVNSHHTYWVDKVCLVLFPTLYILFNIFYWRQFL